MPNTIQGMKRKKHQLTSKQQALHDSNEQMLAKWASVPKFARTPAPVKVAPVKAPETVIRQTPKPQSLVTPGGSTALKPVPVYTGNKMLGIATMHKSNESPPTSVANLCTLAHASFGLGS